MPMLNRCACVSSVQCKVKLIILALGVQCKREFDQGDACKFKEQKCCLCSRCKRKCRRSCQLWVSRPGSGSAVTLRPPPLPGLPSRLAHLRLFVGLAASGWVAETYPCFLPLIHMAPAQETAEPFPRPLQCAWRCSGKLVAGCSRTEMAANYCQL